jgi:hypothetical protein
LAAGNLGREPFGELLPGISAVFPAGEIAHRPRLHQASQARVLRPGPAMFEIQGIPQGVVNLLPPWRPNIHRAATGQLDARHDDVNVLRAVFLLV